MGLNSNMGQNDQTLKILIDPKRWTFGVAWEYYDNHFGDYRLEISIQIPIIALSILFQKTNI